MSSDLNFSKMFPVVFYVIALGCMVPSEAVTNLLGPGVNFPLLKWDGDQLIATFNEDQMLGKMCTDNEVPSETFTATTAKMRHCKDELKGDPAERCKNLDTFLKCMEEPSGELKKVCQFDEKDVQYINSIIASNKEIMEEICNDDAHLYTEFVKNNGTKCAKTHRADIQKCVDDNKMDNMKYDEEGCKKGWDFISCVKTTLEACNSEAAEIAENIMENGLEATTCKDRGASSASSVAANTMILSLASFVAFVKN